MNIHPKLSADDQRRLDDFHARMSRLRRYYVGYPCNEDFAPPRSR